ncbi:hypothetical protein WH50_05630 [Pokkaliibacter plantistimulans]|uniref:Uncharacterized protein n=1 Tax=Pokkaliibacter plantistimulans TaxID=1635171 RepID=A0ABX5M3F1_9GAMM|nr:hypothetical protein WH50_05630 [Pokkaliibacter plantistimulans]
MRCKPTAQAIGRGGFDSALHDRLSKAVSGGEGGYDLLHASDGLLSRDVPTVTTASLTGAGDRRAMVTDSAARKWQQEGVAG